MGDFPTKEYKAMLITRNKAALMGIESMEPWKVDDAARLMAIVQVFGNNENFTLSPKFNADREYIQDTYGISGGETPDALFQACLRKWVKTYEGVHDEKDSSFIDASRWISKMYGFKLLC